MAYLGGGSAFINDTPRQSFISVALTPSVTAGSLLVLNVSWYSGDGVQSTNGNPTDSRGNTWAWLGPAIFNANGQAWRMAYALNAAAGATTVTVNWTAGLIYTRISVAEYSGVLTSAALDGYTQQAATSTTAANGATSGSITTTTAGDLIVGGFMDFVGAATSHTAGTGFTLRQMPGTNDSGLEDRIQASAGSVAATWTFNAASGYGAGVAAFKSAGGGTPTYTGTLSASIPRVTASIAGVVTAPTYTGTVSASVPRATASIAGTVTPPTYSGTMAGTLPTTTGSISGAATPPTYTGTLTAAIPPTRSTITGTVSTPAGGATLSATLPRITGTLSGTVTAPTWTGTLGGQLAPITGNMLGTVTGPLFAGTLDATLPKVTGSVTGTATVPTGAGSLVATLPRLTGSLVGVVEVDVSGFEDITVVASLAPRRTAASLADRTTSATLAARRTTATLEDR